MRLWILAQPYSPCTTLHVRVYEQVVKRFNAKSRRGKDAKKFVEGTTLFAPSLLGDFALKKGIYSAS
jgi:hypothetical protein